MPQRGRSGHGSDEEDNTEGYSTWGQTHERPCSRDVFPRGRDTSVVRPPLHRRCIMPLSLPETRSTCGPSVVFSRPVPPRRVAVPVRSSCGPRGDHADDQLRSRRQLGRPSEPRPAPTTPATARSTPGCSRRSATTLRCSPTRSAPTRSRAATRSARARRRTRIPSSSPRTTRPTRSSRSRSPPATRTARSRSASRGRSRRSTSTSTSTASASNGTLDPQPVAQAASTADPERATRFEAIAGEPIHAGTYWVYVDNWCSNDHDPFTVRFFGGFCQSEDAPLSNSDEDDFIGQVTFTPFVADNKLPSVSLSGPDTGRTNTDLTFVPPAAIRTGRSPATRSTSTATGASSTTTARAAR